MLSSSATVHNRPNTAESPRFEPIARTLLMPRRLHDNVRLDPAPAKALRAAGPPTCCDRESVGSRHPFRSEPRGPSAAGTGNCPDESLQNNVNHADCRPNTDELLHPFRGCLAIPAGSIKCKIVVLGKADPIRTGRSRRAPKSRGSGDPSSLERWLKHPPSNA